LLSLHPSPDGDSLGGCAAMKYFLERDFCAKVDLISPSQLPENFYSLSVVNEIKIGEDLADIDTKNYDLILLMDYGSLKSFSVKKMGSLFLSSEVFVINMDHHPTNHFFGSLNYVDSTQPSLCSLLVDFFVDRNVKFDAELASRLLIGVCTDSGFFTFDTNPNKAISDAMFLISNGGEYLERVLSPILYNQPLKFKKFLGYLFSNIKINNEFKCGYALVPLDIVNNFGLNGSEVALGVNELQFISEFDFVFTIVEFEDYFKVSFRSKKRVDVSWFVKDMNGGGHRATAAFSLPKMSIEDAENRVLKLIKRVGITRY